MTLLHQAQVSGWLRGHLLCRVDDTPGRFALTFDDGPDPAFTPQVLEVLARHGAHATFFMLRPSVRRHPALARRVLEAGHEIGNHGDRHLPLLVSPPPWLAHEVDSGERAIEQATGVRPRFYRPPFGLMFPSQARWVRSRGYEPVLGDVYPEDPQRPGIETITRRVLARLTAGSIVILHDGSAWVRMDRSQTVAALDRILAWAAAQGLKGVSVGELLDQESSEAGWPDRKA